MNKEKNITISEETVDCMRLSINAISDLAAELYNDVFGYTTFHAAIDTNVYKDERDASFFWMLNNYDRLQASVLSISAIARLLTEKIPE